MAQVAQDKAPNKLAVSCKHKLLMNSTFQPSLLNDPFGDPGLLVEHENSSDVFLFDLGDLSGIPSKLLLKASHVFISHTHIDHFIGFDRLLRVSFGQGKTIHLFGPENITANVAGKLAGFTWNLVELYDESLTIAVTEVHEDRLIKTQFRAIDKFQPSAEQSLPFQDGLLVDEKDFTIHTAILEHRVPCLGYALKEKPKAHIDKEQLESLDAVAGPWLNELKSAALENKADDFLLHAPTIKNDTRNLKEIPFGLLKNKLVTVSAGYKIVYVTDTLFSEANNKRIVALADQADLFFCESPFIAEETDRARDRRHLTTEQAGTLARTAGVKRLQLFHFSRRHVGHAQRFYREAESAFGQPVLPSKSLFSKKKRPKRSQDVCS
jgi:ribonuclease Z